MINVTTILNYFLKSIEIPSIANIIPIHKNIELYLSEWKDYIRNSIHGQIDVANIKNLII